MPTKMRLNYASAVVNLELSHSPLQGPMLIFTQLPEHISPVAMTKALQGHSTVKWPNLPVVQ